VISGADALLHAYQRASANGMQLRVAAADRGVRSALDAARLDGLVLLQPSVEAAAGAAAPARAPVSARVTAKTAVTCGALAWLRRLSGRLADVYGRPW
jgi:hypothetical protein